MRKIIIQEEIAITQKEVDEIIKYYEELPDTFRLGILGEVMDKNAIIREIKRLSKFGKKILLMDYKFRKYDKSLSTQAPRKSFPLRKKVKTKNVTNV